MSLSSKSPKQKSGYVTIVGRPNVGKSTLLNQILGSSLSIVSPKPQTTRDQFLGVHTCEKGQMVFVDTPGIHRVKGDGINAYMMGQARMALEAPDVIWYLVDPLTELKREVVVMDMLAQFPAPVFLIINKMDLNRSQKKKAHVEALTVSLREAIKERSIQCLGEFQISAMKSKGVEELLEETWSRLPLGELYFPDQDQLSDRPMRYIVQEMIREQLYFCLGEELPYACAVRVESFEENGKVPRIEATLIVEKESHKPMVIGQSGKMIKRIGESARKRVEELLGKQIFLGLRVKVIPDWSETPNGLTRAGYDVPKEMKSSYQSKRNQNKQPNSRGKKTKPKAAPERLSVQKAADLDDLTALPSLETPAPRSIQIKKKPSRDAKKKPFDKKKGSSFSGRPFRVKKRKRSGSVGGVNKKPSSSRS